MNENGHQRNISELFEKYAEDNNYSLTGLGVIGTVTALFLSLDVEQYSQSLIEIQTVLLSLLIIASIYIATATFRWINNNADGWFASIVGSLTFLLPWYEIRFLHENFREELSSLLGFFLITVTIGLAVFCSRHANKIAGYIKEKWSVSNFFIFPIFNTIGVFIVLTTLDVYKAFYKNESVDFITTVHEQITDPLIKIMFAISLFAEFIFVQNYLNLRKKTALFIGVLATTIIILGYIVKLFYNLTQG